MKTRNIQQEILLIKGTTFSQRECCEKDHTANDRPFSQNEKLEMACWDGLLGELLPGIILKSAKGNNLYPWQVRHCTSFLEIELCEYPGRINEYFSIDPYLFLSTLYYN